MMNTLLRQPLLKRSNLSSKTFRYLSILFLLTLLSACSKSEPTSASLYVFGTLVEITIYDQDSQKAQHAITQVETKFQNFHKEWHAWEKGGIVSKINQAIKNRKPIEVADSVKQFILKSQQLSQQSQGLFDPGIGGLIALWGFHKEVWQGPPPSTASIDQWLTSSPSIGDIHFEEQRLFSNNPQVQLDFGGNAKGLAIDIAMNTLKQAGIENALVSIGGDMKAMGSKEGEPWSIGIQSPQNPSKALAKILLSGNESIVTSGDYQRFFEWQGKHYSHIINPKTGYPADTFSSVTVIHHDATTADAAATAIMIAGPKQWRSIARSMHIEQVFCIDHQGNIEQTDAMKKRIERL